VQLGQAHHAADVGELPPTRPDVGPYGRLGDIGAVLVAQAHPDAPGGVALLGRGAAVRLEDLIDHHLPLPEHRRGALRALALRRHRRGEGLADHPTVDVVLGGQAPDAQSEVTAVPTYLLE